MTNILRYDMNRFAMVVVLFTILSLIGMLGAALLTPVADAALTDVADLSQVITDGTVAVEVRSDATTPVANPDYAMPSAAFSFNCQQVIGTNALGDNAERIYVDDPSKSGAGSGWDLSIAASGGTTAAWVNQGTGTDYDFNDAGGAPVGCVDDLDVDGIAGALTIDPSVLTYTTDCAVCDNSTGLTKGASATFQEVATAVTDITLGSSDGSQNIGRWYITGATMSQYIPAEQIADSYKLGMTLTIAEN